MASRLARVALLFLCFLNPVLAIWPLPVEASYGSDVLWLSDDFQTICYDKKPSSLGWDNFQAVVWPWSAPDLPVEDDVCNEERLKSAVERFREDVTTQSFVPWKFHPKDANFEPDPWVQRTYIRKIQFETLRLVVEPVEAYTLTITQEGDVLIVLNNPLGGIRALATITQLFYQHSDPVAGVYMTTAPLAVRDSPMFEHRGFNLDISRNIISPKQVMRTIDAMAFNKLNRLHLHASDAQSWPLEIPSLPDLARKGAYQKSQIWSVADLREVQAFAAQRGVDVYIEIDMPGHTASVQEAYPELITSFNRKPWPTYSAQPPSGQLKLNDPNVTAFITTLLNDLLPRVSPFSPLFHLGGDEITASAYDMSASEVQPYLQSFVDHAISLVQLHGQIPVVWEEQLLDYNLTLPQDTLIQAWRGSAPETPSSLARIVARGHKALFGANDYWYLDCGHGGWVDPDPNNSDSPIKSPFMDYCAPLHNWREVYSYDPLADIPDGQTHLVIGGEASMWAEQTDEVNLDGNLWPRLAAAGEVLWRGKGTVSEDVTRRLAEMREWLVQKRIQAGPVQVTWCLMNAGLCVL